MKRIFTYMGKTNRGFTMFFATLVASLALLVGIAIYDIISRQLVLSTEVEQSEYAIYAADSGAECALYWDSKYGGSGTVFPSFATTTVVLPTSGIVCGAFDVAAVGTPPATFQPQPTGWTPWTAVAGATYATTTFMITFPPHPYCARIEVGKVAVSDGLSKTIILSHGFNTCATNAQNQIEREIKVNY